MKIYAISGLEADARVFNSLSLNTPLIPIPWITPLPHESIRDYAQRLAKAIDTNEAFILLGVSFGGFIATEISQFLSPVATLLISTTDSYKDFPWYYRQAKIGKLLTYLLAVLKYPI